MKFLARLKSWSTRRSGRGERSVREPLERARYSDLEPTQTVIRRHSSYGSEQSYREAIIDKGIGPSSPAKTPHPHKDVEAPIQIVTDPPKDGHETTAILLVNSPHEERVVDEIENGSHRDQGKFSHSLGPGPFQHGRSPAEGPSDVSNAKMSVLYNALSRTFTNAAKTQTRRKRFENPQDSIGATINKSRNGTYWATANKALNVAESLGRVVDDCLCGADIPKEIFCNYYMWGNSEDTASPAIVISGGDQESREMARAKIRDYRILKEPRYMGWTVRLTQHDPAFKGLGIIRMVLNESSGLDSLSIRKDDLSFTMNSKTKLCFVRNLKAQKLATGTLSGPIRILNEIYYLTSAHIFTGTSPFDEVDTVGEGLEAESDGDDESTCWADDESESSKLRISLSLTDEPSDFGATPSNGPQRQSEPNNDENSYDSDSEHLVPLHWPEDQVSIFFGPAELDYALVKWPKYLTDQYEYGVTQGFEWYLPRDATQFAPAGELRILTAGRVRPRGSFLPTAMSVKSPGTPAPRHFWVYFPSFNEIENRITPGDSGALVCGDGKVHGHVIAGNPDTGAAIVVPSEQLYIDIKNRIGIPEFPRAPYSSRPKISDKQTESSKDFTALRAFEGGSSPLELMQSIDEPMGAGSTKRSTDKKLSRSLTQDVVEPPPIGNANDSLETRTGAISRDIHCNSKTDQDKLSPSTPVVPKPKENLGTPSKSTLASRDTKVGESLGIRSQHRDDANVKHSQNSARKRSVPENPSLPEIPSYVDTIAAINLLLDAGADVNTRDQGGRTVLMQALLRPVYFPRSLNNLQHVSTLEKDGTFMNPGLITEAGYPNVAVLGRLLQAGADVNASDWNGKTALHYAADQTPINNNIIKMLLAAKADCHVVTRESRTALMHAVLPANLYALALRDDEQAFAGNKSLDPRPTPKSQANQEPTQTPGFDVSGNLAGPLDNDVPLQDSTARDLSPLGLAVLGGHLGIVEQLLAAGARPMPEALQDASAHGNPEIVRLLLEYGADPNMGSGSHIHRAASRQLQPHSSQGSIFDTNEHGDAAERHSEIQPQTLVPVELPDVQAQARDPASSPGASDQDDTSPFPMSISSDRTKVEQRIRSDKKYSIAENRMNSLVSPRTHEQGTVLAGARKEQERFVTGNEETGRDKFKGKSPAGPQSSNNLLSQKALVQDNEIRGGNFGSHERTAAIMHNQAALFWLEEDRDTAVDLMDRVVELRQSYLGSEHPDTLFSMHSLAIMYRHRRQFAASNRMMDKVILRRQKILGHEHPETLMSMHHKAKTMLLEKKWIEAEALLNTVIMRQAAILGQQHPSTISSMRDLLTVLRAQKRRKEVHMLQQEIKFRQEKQHSSADPV